jgi:hypothetical protein
MRGKGRIGEEDDGTEDGGKDESVYPHSGEKAKKASKKRKAGETREGKSEATAISKQAAPEEVSDDEAPAKKKRKSKKARADAEDQDAIIVDEDEDAPLPSDHQAKTLPRLVKQIQVWPFPSTNPRLMCGMPRSPSFFGALTTRFLTHILFIFCSQKCVKWMVGRYMRQCNCSTKVLRFHSSQGNASTSPQNVRLSWARR